jgi:hypothetical protein
MSTNPTSRGPHRNSSQLNQDLTTQRTGAQPESMTHANRSYDCLTARPATCITVPAHSGTPPTMDAIPPLCVTALQAPTPPTTGIMDLCLSGLQTAATIISSVFTDGVIPVWLADLTYTSRGITGSPQSDF